MKVLRIRNWNDHFENNRTRELRRLDWVPIPNKMDGNGYTMLLDHPAGAAHYGCWCAIALIASKCDVRGTLQKDGRSLDSAALARMSRMPQPIMSEALLRLVSEIEWIEEVDMNQQDIRGSRNPAPSCDIPAPSCGPHARAEKGMEWKGIEEKRKSSSVRRPGESPRKAESARRTDDDNMKPPTQEPPVPTQGESPSTAESAAALSTSAGESPVSDIALPKASKGESPSNAESAETKPLGRVVWEFMVQYVANIAEKSGEAASPPGDPPTHIASQIAKLLAAHCKDPVESFRALLLAKYQAGHRPRASWRFFLKLVQNAIEEGELT